MSIQVTPVITWRLREFMARDKISVGQLAETLQVSRTTASGLKNAETMPSNLDGKKMNAICKLFNCQPGDLLQWLPDDDAA
jgi:putative transcriptional regulator